MYSLAGVHFYVESIESTAWHLSLLIIRKKACVDSISKALAF